MKKQLAKKDLQNIQSNITAITDSDVLPPAIMAQLEEKIPLWLKEYEADGTSVLRWNYELLMLIEHLIQEELGVSDDELLRVEKKLKDILPVIQKMKVKEPRLLKREDFALASAMVERNKQLFQREKSRIAIPSQQEITKLKGGG